MTIVQLEYLVAVAQYGSFSIAAEKCFVTQPSLSIQIKNLEEELGVILVDRSKKPVELTDAGQKVLLKTQAVLSAVKQVKESVLEMQGKVSGELRIAAIPTVAPYLLHKFVPSFHKKYPEVKLSIYEYKTSEIIDALLRETLDVGILAEGFVPATITEEPLFDDPFYAFVSPDHRLIDEKKVSLASLDPSELLLLTEGHCLRTQILNVCSSIEQEKSDMTIECGALDTLLRLTVATEGITIVPKMSLNFLPKIDPRCIKPIVEDDAVRTISLATNRYFPKQTLLKVLKKEIMESVQLDLML